jgi:hypothetical protein
MIDRGSLRIDFDCFRTPRPEGGMFHEVGRDSLAMIPNGLGGGPKVLIGPLFHASASATIPALRCGNELSSYCS